MRKGVTELVPPVLTDDLRRVDVVDGPEMRVAFLVQKDGLEDVVFKGDLGRELGLVVCAVEAHFQLAAVLGVHLNVVHWLKGLLGHFEAHGLVDAREGTDGLGGRVEVFVIALHVVAVGVGDGDVVGEFGAAKDFLFAIAGGGFEDSVGGVGSVLYVNNVTKVYICSLNDHHTRHIRQFRQTPPPILRHPDHCHFQSPRHYSGYVRPRLSSS